MNPHPTHASWRQLKIQLQKTWSELTDADVDLISRNSDDLAQVVYHRCVYQRMRRKVYGYDSCCVRCHG